MRKILLLILFCVIITGCSSKITENTPKPEIMFSSTHDLEQNLNYLIEDSEEIKCAFYDLNIESTISLLKEKKAELILDDGNVLGIGEVTDDGGLMHDKFCVFDSKIVWAGSFNPTVTGVKNDNNVIVFFSPTIASVYLEEFDEMQKGEFKGGKSTKRNIVNDIEIYFCPEDDCKDRVLLELNKANSSIYFMTFTFTHKEIADMLVVKNDMGIDVKGIVEKNRINMEYEKYYYLNQSFEVKVDKTSNTMHHKVFIIDNRTVIAGSFNPTISADERNDENLIIIHNEEIAVEFLREFDRLFY